ncbi:MAG TPA: triose-phosphate isomerase [Candidatus Saccharimonadales bacterium]|nr:triose-phosphate isomerase [Candidatus Saccharimonadales bacterium]
MSKKLIVANWKMHFDVGKASIFLHRLQERVPTFTNVEVVLCPNFIALQSLSLQIDNHKFKLGAQDCYHRDEGAYTGATSATMLRGLVKYVIVGHSERRHVFGETDKEIALKVAAAVRNGLTPILCVGETGEERRDGEMKAVLHDQITTGVMHLTRNEIKEIVIAYEPVWAIGTGKEDSPDDAVEAIDVIRSQIKSLYGAPASLMVRILYGGSVTPDDIVAYVARESIDGALVGGASLNYNSFAQIVEKTHLAVGES